MACPTIMFCVILVVWGAHADTLMETQLNNISNDVSLCNDKIDRGLECDAQIMVRQLS